MIDVQQHRQWTERQCWSSTVQQMFQTLELQDRPAAQEIAESLATFCQQHARMPSAALSLLMARSFCAVGDREAAGQILRSNRTHRPHTGSWLEILSAGYPFPELYPLFSSRALRPQNLTSTGTLWVLDLTKIGRTEADQHELILFQTVRLLIEQVSNVWKKTDGHGTLGVKGLTALTAGLHSRNEQTARQLLDLMGDLLARCARQNNWAAVPSVLQLEL